MRFTLVPVLLFAAAACHAADDPPTASRTLGGKTTQFPAKTIAEGVKAMIGVLESCHSSDATYTAADLNKAQQGDHVRIAFPKPIPVTVLGKGFEVSEVVYAGGVFWVLAGETVVRSTKYEHEKWKPFEEWFRQPL